VIKRMKIEAEGWSDWREASRGVLQRLLNEQMKDRQKEYLKEVALRGGSDRCNGSYRRHLLTVLGDIELSVPRTRAFSARSVVAAYARREQHVDRLILSCFVLGLSTRKVGEALLTILGQRVSPATVSRVAQTLDRAVAAFHRRRLNNSYRVLIFDGVVLSRRTGAGAKRRPVLVALGITAERKKEIIDYRFAPAESEGAWEAFLTDLYRRGLTGEGVEMIATDGGAGMLAALPLVYPLVPVQRCWAHKTRNILDKMKKADRDEARADLHRISHAANRVLARKAAGQFAKRWGSKYPKALACLRDDLEELLVFFLYQDEEWRKATRTTNAIERRFVEVRRRTRPMGVFSDRTSMDRILFAVFSYENKKEGTAPLFLLTQNS
jgi:transposase-like protein